MAAKKKASKVKIERVRRPLWLKFGTGVVVLLLLALVVNTLIISVIISGDVRVTAEANNYYTNQQRSQRVEESIQSIMDESRLQLGVLAASPSQSLRDISMENFFRVHRGIAAIVVAGGVTGTDSPEIRLVNDSFFAVNKIDTGLLDTVLGTVRDDLDAAAYGSAVLRNVSSQFNFPMIAMLFPTDSGKSQGIAIFFSSQQYLTDFGTGTSQSFMLSGGGELLVHSNSDTLKAGDARETEAVKSILMATDLMDMQTVIKDLSGEQYFCAFKKLQRLDSVVVTQVSYTTVFESVRATVRRNVYLAVAILSVAISFAWFFSRSITRPIKGLVQAVQQVKQGDYDIHLEVKGRDELAVLGTGFVSMSESLKKTHQELRDMNEGLERTVRDRTAALEKQTQIANAASKAKSDFLATMSHEIRTPMNAIMGMIEIMDASNLTAKQLSYFHDIQMMSTALLNIINDILDISKIEAGKLELVPVHYDLYALFDNVGKVNSFSAAAKSLALLTKKSPRVPRCLFGDEIRVRQIFTNIMSNAIKYTSEGSVEAMLRAGTDKTGKQHVVFTVKDTGIGIKKEEIPKLFGNFQRLDAQKTRTIQGTGLGLAITKQLVEMMGGTIKVESEYGKGSTFTVTFPLVPGDLRKIKSTEDRNRFVRARTGFVPRILVTDDIQINLRVALGFLEKHGMKADTACDGLDAYHKVIAKEKTGDGYDLVFLDLLMPNLDGISAMKKIRAQGGRFRIMPIVALTANAMTETTEECLKAGMSDFLSKPMTDPALNAILAKWLPQEKILFTKSPDGIGTAYSALSNAPAKAPAQAPHPAASAPAPAQAPHPAAPAPAKAPAKAAPASAQAPHPAAPAPATAPAKAAPAPAQAPHPAASAPAPAPAQAPAPEADPLARVSKVPGLDVKTGLEFCAGDPAFYKSMLKQFCDDFEPLKNAIINDARRRDWKDFSIKTHGIKSSLAMLGAMDLSEQARKLEMAGKAADLKKSAAEVRYCAAQTLPMLKGVSALRSRLLMALE
ncbi:MAG: response regulator [Treponema sp.]|jgi:signal transduction histidine kinase/CheY-like chemotaxis protein/HPt (histidine-containing phosphotransfer) domain-containing protein|nr:response regulator [Treponema sp.]